MSIFRRLSNGLSCGDSIPFYHDGMYHLFFLSVPENTVRYPERVRNTWQHVVSKILWNGKKCNQHFFLGMEQSLIRMDVGRDQ